MRVTTRKKPSQWRKVLVVGVVGIATIAVAILMFRHIANSAAPVAPIASMSPVTPAPSNVTAPLTFDQLDSAQAQNTLAQQNWHYRCRTYPPANALKTNDLIPTANVVVTIKYDEKAKQYVASSDEQVKMNTSTYIEPPNSDFKEPTKFTKLTWTYANGGIKHYIVAEEFRETNGDVKVATLAGVYDQQTKRYTLSLPTTSTRVYTYRIIATDSTTCEGKNTLTDKWWAQLRANGLMAPDPVG